MHRYCVRFDRLAVHPDVDGGIAIDLPADHWRSHGFADAASADTYRELVIAEYAAGGVLVAGAVMPTRRARILRVVTWPIRLAGRVILFWVQLIGERESPW